MTTNILNYFKEIHQYKSTKGQFFKQINFEYSTETLHFFFPFKNAFKNHKDKYSTKFPSVIVFV